jgi:hypothetical protein
MDDVARRGAGCEREELRNQLAGAADGVAAPAAGLRDHKKLTGSAGESADDCGDGGRAHAGMVDRGEKESVGVVRNGGEAALQRTELAARVIGIHHNGIRNLHRETEANGFGVMSKHQDDRRAPRFPEQSG